jgi:ankyrin repeat protein
LSVIPPTVCFADDGETLRAAARSGDVAGVKAVLEQSSDINAATPYGVTALSIACDHGNLDVVQLLVASAAEVNTKYRFYKFSPIARAAMHKHTEIVRFLIAARATDVDGVFGNAIGMGLRSTYIQQASKAASSMIRCSLNRPSQKAPVQSSSALARRAIGSDRARINKRNPTIARERT